MSVVRQLMHKAAAKMRSQSRKAKSMVQDVPVTPIPTGETKSYLEEPESSTLSQSDTEHKKAAANPRLTSPALGLLPPETIREIIMQATNTLPDPYSSHRRSVNDEFGLPPIVGTYRDRRSERILHQKGMEMKLAASAVSRLWRELSKEFLFNSIRIASSRQVPLLWYALEGDRARCGGVEGPGSAAWWIREIRFEDEVRFRWYITLEDGLPKFSFFDLLRRCPNVISFQNWAFFINGRCPTESFTQATLEGIVGRTRAAKGVKEIVASFRTQHSDIFMQQLASCRAVSDPPSVHIVKLHLTLEHDFIHDIPIHTADFPHLADLLLDGSIAIVQATAFTMPALRYLTIGPQLLPGAHATPAFLQKHGGNLVELALLGYSYDVGDLNISCPLLQTLNVDLSHAMSPVRRHDHVTKLGIVGLDKALLLRLDMADARVRLAQCLEGLPSVRVVQDLSWKSQVDRERVRTPEETIQFQSYWNGFLKQLEDARAVLLDWRGRPVIVDRRRELREAGDLLMDELQLVMPLT